MGSETGFEMRERVSNVWWKWVPEAETEQLKGQRDGGGGGSEWMGGGSNVEEVS